MITNQQELNIQLYMRMAIIIKKKHDKIILLARTKLNTIEDLISRALIDPYICHNEVGLINNVAREYDGLKKANLMI